MRRDLGFGLMDDDMEGKENGVSDRGPGHGIRVTKGWSSRRRGTSLGFVRGYTFGMSDTSKIENRRVNRVHQVVCDSVLTTLDKIHDPRGY